MFDLCTFWNDETFISGNTWNEAEVNVVRRWSEEAVDKGVKEGIMSMNEPLVVAKGPGRTSKEEAVESDEVRRGKLIRRGASAALAQLAEVFGERMFEVVPMLWHCMSSALLSTFGSTAAEADRLIAQQDDLGQSLLLAHLHLMLRHRLECDGSNFVRSSYHTHPTRTADKLLHRRLSRGFPLYAVRHRSHPGWRASASGMS